MTILSIHNKWHWFGTLSVAPNGRIDAVWYDTRNAANNTDSQLFYSYSTDGGVTWSPNVAVSNSFNPFEGYPNQNKIGDYITIVSDNTGGNVAYSATFNFNPNAVGSTKKMFITCGYLHRAEAHRRRHPQLAHTYLRHRQLHPQRRNGHSDSYAYGYSDATPTRYDQHATATATPRPDADAEIGRRRGPSHAPAETLSPTSESGDRCVRANVDRLLSPGVQPRRGLSRRIAGRSSTASAAARVAATPIAAPRNQVSILLPNISGIFLDNFVVLD